jgi:hypothetical protein
MTTELHAKLSVIYGGNVVSIVFSVNADDIPFGKHSLINKGMSKYNDKLES